MLTTIAAALLTALIAMPVLRAPTTQLFGHELAGRHHDPFTVIEQYAAGGVPGAYLQPATDRPGMALAQIIAPVAAYNTLVLGTFVLAAMFAYAHAYYLIGSGSGAAVAALLFAFSPFHIAHSAYHVHIAQIQWIPLFFLCLWRLLDRPSVRRAVATGVALLITAAASLYLGFVTASIAPVAVAAYLAARPRASPPARAAMWAMATLLSTAAVVLGAIAVLAPEVLHQPDAFAFPASAIDQHSARWWSYLIPPAGHPLFGERSVALLQSHGVQEGMLEQQVSLGLSVLGLALVPLMRRRAADRPQAFAAAALVAVALVAGACSLPAVASTLHPLAPMFRAYARFGVIVSLMISTLAGAGVALLLQRSGRGRSALASVLIGAALFEYMPAMPASRDTLPTRAHRWLADAQGLRVFDCAPPTSGSRAGVAALMASAVVFPAGPLEDCAEPHFAAKLAVFDVTHLLVRHDGGRGSWVLAGGAPDGTRVLQSFSDATVFAVTTPKPPVYVAEMPGFYAREFRGRDSWRWMAREGAITIINTASTPGSVWLDLELDAYDRERDVRVTGPGSGAAAILKVTRTTARHTLGPLALRAGDNTVTLVADAASSPRDVSGLPDPRPLSIRLRRWTVRDSVSQ